MLYTTANINIVNNDTYIFLVLRANTDRGRKHKVSIGKRTTLCNFVYKKTKHPPETYSQILRQLLNLMYQQS